MSGPPPKAQRRRRNAPQRGDWQAIDGIGWQHGPTPEAPADVLPVTREAWGVWMAGWPAAHWTPGDLPALHVLAALYDQVRRGHYQRVSELRLWLDAYGLTPKGQQDRRWQQPAATPDPQPRPARETPDEYRHLRVMDGSQ